MTDWSIWFDRRMHSIRRSPLCVWSGEEWHVLCAGPKSNCLCLWLLLSFHFWALLLRFTIMKQSRIRPTSHTPQADLFADWPTQLPTDSSWKAWIRYVSVAHFIFWNEISEEKRNQNPELMRSWGMNTWIFNDKVQGTSSAKRKLF